LLIAAVELLFGIRSDNFRQPAKHFSFAGTDVTAGNSQNIFHLPEPTSPPARNQFPDKTISGNSHSNFELPDSTSPPAAHYPTLDCRI